MTADRPNPLDVLADKTANPFAERAVIAALCRLPPDDAARRIIQHGIIVDLFANELTREAFVAIHALTADGVYPDAATLTDATSDPVLIEIETSLKEHVSTANLPHWVARLKACQREREIEAARERLAKALAAGCTPNELRPILDSIEQAQAGADNQPPRFLWADDFCQNGALEDDLIEGYIPASSVGVLFGDSEAYKSFLLIDMAGHIATGQTWRGCPVKSGKVLFIAGEGGNGLRTRVKAWFERHQQPMRNFAISVVPLELCDPKNVDLLVSEIRRFIGDEKVSFIALDTLNTHFGPGDENSTADMTKFRLGVLKLSQATGAAVAISHHCGHSDKTRLRGSITLHNGIDWEFKLERSGDYTTLSNTKVKDGPPPPPLSWKLIQQKLPWADKKGNPINGAVLESADCQIPDRTDRTDRTSRTTGKTRIALNALRSALIQDGTEERGIVSVDEDQWRSVAYKSGIAASDATQDGRRKAFNRAREKLVSAETVACSNGRYWIPANRTDRTDRTKPDICPGVSGLGMGTDRPDKTGHTPIRGVRLSGCPGSPDVAHDARVCAGSETNAELTQTNAPSPDSPLARRILAAFEGCPGGITHDDLARLVGNEKGASQAMIDAEVSRLLLAGKLGRVNGRLVLEVAP